MMLPFKKGAFHLAVQAQVPIVPIICQNYWHLYHAGVLEPGTLRIVGKRYTQSMVDSRQHIAHQPHRPAYNHFSRIVLDPVPTAGLTSADVPELMLRVRDFMVARLCSISAVATPVSPTAAGERTRRLSPERPTPVTPSAHNTNGEGSDEDAVLVDRPRDEM
jgi:lysophosphatidate acyltransferase